MALSIRESLVQAHKLPHDRDLLLKRCVMLDGVDRDLVEAVVVRGQTASSLARLMGIAPRTIRRRVQRISRRMATKSFLNSVKALPYLADDEALLARRYYCQKLPRVLIARELGVTTYVLRRRLDQLAAKIATIANLSRPARGVGQPVVAQPWRQYTRR